MTRKYIFSIVLNNFTNDSRVLKECRSLIDLDCKVSVIAMHSEGLAEQEFIDDIDVRRIKLRSKGWSTIYVVKLVKYVEFLIKSVWYARNRADILHCNDLNGLIPGCLIKMLSSRPVSIVYDAHEYETEVLGLTPFIRKVLRFIERRLLNRVSAVITVGDKIASEYQRIYGIDLPVVVMNCPEKSRALKGSYFRRHFDISEDQTIFLYQGGLAPGRGVEQLLHAFQGFKDAKAVLILMGYGTLTSLVETAASDCSNIYYHQAVSSKKLLRYTACADFGFSFIEDVCLSYRYCLPNKLFEYANARVPVIISNLPEMRRMVEMYSLGIVAEEISTYGVRKAVVKAMSMDKNDFFSSGELEDLTWEHQVEKFKKVYAPILDE